MVFVLLEMLFFFFKQKTAYEMRISDWSSDVCSSDLKCLSQILKIFIRELWDRDGQSYLRLRGLSPRRQGCQTGRRPLAGLIEWECYPRRCQTARSEEHTSELQSLMRISYAVFCLKKKKYNPNNPAYGHNSQHATI